MSIWATGHRLGAMTPVEIRLRELRKALGLTQVQLAKKAHMDQGDVSRIEKGTKQISLDMLDRLCKALKCEPGDILVRKRRR